LRFFAAEFEEGKKRQRIVFIGAQNERKKPPESVKNGKGKKEESRLSRSQQGKKKRREKNLPISVGTIKGRKGTWRGGGEKGEENVKMILRRKKKRKGGMVTHNVHPLPLDLKKKKGWHFTQKKDLCKRRGSWVLWFVGEGKKGKGRRKENMKRRRKRRRRRSDYLYNMRLAARGGR